jgi:hypothetical protein
MKPSLYLAAVAMLLSHCVTPPAGDPAEKGKAEAASKEAEAEQGKEEAAEAPAPEEGAAPVDVSFLLSMSYAEASSITPAKLELSNARIAADKIDVLKADAEGKPLKVRAKGRVFVEVDFPDSDQARCLSQEAYIDTDEVILRGRPVLQRGGATLEGVTDQTVFFLFGNQVRIIGTHRRTNAQELATDMPLGLPSWEYGPNPLLPPLEESAVPNNIRAELNKALEAEAVRQSTLKPLPAGATIPAPASEPAIEPKAAPEKKAEPKPAAADKATERAKA